MGDQEMASNTGNLGRLSVPCTSVTKRASAPMLEDTEEL
jgi:hypothetical protein